MLKSEERLDAAFRALADGNRRRMLERLTRGSATLTQLAEPLGITLPGVAQHLAVLEEAGLVRTEKRGRFRHCELDRAALGRVERWMRERRIAAADRLDRLEAYLAATEPETGAETDTDTPTRP